MTTPLYKLKAEFFKTLGHPARIRILELLADGEHSVGQLQALVGLEGSHMSQQLAVLRRAGVVVGRKQGNSVIYSMASPDMAELMAVARKVLTGLLSDQMDLLTDSEGQHTRRLTRGALMGGPGKIRRGGRGARAGDNAVDDNAAGGCGAAPDGRRRIGPGHANGCAVQPTAPTGQNNALPHAGGSGSAHDSCACAIGRDAIRRVLSAQACWSSCPSAGWVSPPPVCCCAQSMPLSIWSSWPNLAAAAWPTFSRT